MKKWLQPTFEKWLIVLAGAAGLTAILSNLEFNLLEANFYDLRMSQGPQPEPRKDIVLVTLDNSTAQALSEVPPLGLDIHTRMLEALETMNPKAVGYLVEMNRVAEMNPELFRAEWGSRFVEAARRIESKGGAFLLGTPFDVTGEVVPPFPLSALNHSVALVHKDGNVFAEDKITRRALSYLYGKPVFHMELARMLGAHPAGHQVRGTFEVPEVDARYFFFRYHGNPTDQPYTRVSFVDILNGSAKRELIEGKIVLVGSQIKEDSSDFVFTPYSKRALQNPKITVHAAILDSILANDGIERAGALANWLITFCLIAGVLWWVLISKPIHGVFATLGLAALFYGAALLLFSFQGYWIRASQPIVGIFLAYYLVVPYRLIREYKKRWDYQRKNELLIQVEELKTNFLSLVTHDLKTPVARIQGLAEVLLRKASERLIDRDRETVGAIIHATEELNRFISSILELNKVESNRLQIQMESKDINQLIEKALEDFKAQARARQIRINSQLEPLFPIRIDSSLISKVINNLIDNALKYSPAGSDVTIESREENNQVVISVRDNGIGMTDEEREQLFTRFYRAKNDTTTRISGTGLGLYLTKYFIEAHRGSVEVESEKGKGTTFRIRLPLEPLDTALPPPPPSGLSVRIKKFGKPILSKSVMKE